MNVSFDETKFLGLHDEGQMELQRFESQGFLEDEELVNDEPTFTHTVEDGEVVVNNLNGDPAQSQEVSTNHPTNGDSGNMDDRNEGTSHSVGTFRLTACSHVSYHKMNPKQMMKHCWIQIG